jgi:hypothetical protein
MYCLRRLGIAESDINSLIYTMLELENLVIYDLTYNVTVLPVI